jgi:hypothetical protein
MDPDAKNSSSIQQYLESPSRQSDGTANLENRPTYTEWISFPGDVPGKMTVLERKRSLPTMLESCRSSCNCTCMFNDDKPAKEDWTILPPSMDGQTPFMPTKDEEALLTAATQQGTRGHSGLTAAGIQYMIAAVLVILVLDSIIIFHYHGEIFDNITAWLLWSLSTYSGIAVVTAAMITLPTNPHVKGLLLFVSIIGIALGCGFVTFPPWSTPKP